MKYKRTTLSLTFLLVGFGGLLAQETIPTTGGNASGTGGSLSYTIGQVVYTTHTGANGTVEQGVQKPYEISITVGADVAEINISLAAYPNPTNNRLTLSIDDYSHEENMTYQLLDMQGKLLDSKLIINANTIIGMQNLPVSTYLLNVLDNNSIIKTFRIIKN